MNVYTAVGRIGRDAEVRQAGQSTVAGFPVAVNVGYGDNKKTLWLDASLWGKRAEGGLIQYLTKGKQVAVSGELGTREYQKKDGSPGFAVTLRVNDVTLVGDSQGGQQQPQNTGGGQYGGHAMQSYGQNPQGQWQPPAEDPLDSEIPF